MAASETMTGSVPEELADDVPTDVDFQAVMARAQATLLHLGGLQYQATEDLTQKLAAIGKAPPHVVVPEPG